LIFSHGITSSRHLHQVLFEYLASRGYIIAAPDHSFDANLTIFPDKHLAGYRSDITGHPDSVNIRKQQMSTRGSDISFIIDQLEKLQHGSIKSTLNGKLDLQKIAVAGHSFGGSTATVSAHKDERIKACAVLDSWLSPVPEPIISSGMHVPFLFMGRPSWEGSDYPGNYLRLDRVMAHSSVPKYRLVIKKTLHLDYTDIPLFSPIIGYVMSVGDLSPGVSLPLVNRLVYGFLDKHLTGRNEKIFDETLMNDLIIQF
jgi:pimeloyl-ACP methyl ester carboxylesterase